MYLLKVPLNTKTKPFLKNKTCIHHIFSFSSSTVKKKCVNKITHVHNTIVGF